MRLSPRALITFFLSVCVLCAHAQSDYFKEIKNMDLSKLWRSDSLFVVEHNYNDEHELLMTNPHNVVFPEPLGFIDTGYQRFYIHYISVTRDAKDPYKYIVTGKTRVKDNICPFTGTITIKKAELMKVQEFPMYRRGIIYAEYKFNEDNSKPESGVLAGKLQTGLYTDKAQHIFYDNLDVEADRYCNNQYTGTWTGYKKKKTKKCNWGDYRIPGSNTLDIGTTEFSIKDRYIKNGWQNYVTAHWGTDPYTKDQAADTEKEAWWK